MNYTHLGRTGLKVSRLCLGTMNHAIRRHHELSRRNLARPRGRSAPGLCLVMTKLMNPFCVKGSSSL